MCSKGRQITPPNNDWGTLERAA